MFSLAPYRLSVFSEGSERRLWNEDGKNGFATWFLSYLKDQLGDLQPRPDRRLARVARVCANAEKTFVFGRYQTGEYGYKSELVDSEVNAVSHVRKVSEAEMIPFFYSLASPKQGTWAVLVLQKFKNLGIHDFIVPKLIQDFEASHKNCRLHVQRLVPGTLANTILEGALVKSMRFVSYKLPPGVEDAFGKAGMKESVHEVEFVVRASRGGLLPKLEGFADVLAGRKNVAQIMTLPNLPYDTIKLELDVNGKRRTMDMGKPFKLSPNMDITEDVEAAEDGHPVWDDVSAVAREFSSDLLSAQGVKVEIAGDVELDFSAGQMPDVIVTPDYGFGQPIVGAAENLLRQANGAAGGA